MNINVYLKNGQRVTASVIKTERKVDNLTAKDGKEKTKGTGETYIYHLAAIAQRADSKEMMIVKGKITSPSPLPYVKVDKINTQHLPSTVKLVTSDNVNSLAFLLASFDYGAGEKATPSHSVTEGEYKHSLSGVSKTGVSCALTVQFGYEKESKPTTKKAELKDDTFILPAAFQAEDVKADSN